MAGLIWGCTYHLTVIFWLAGNIGTTPLIGFISMLSAVLFLALNIIAVSFIMYFLKKKFPKKWFWYFPVVWVSMEYIRSMGTLGFPWVSLANTQLDFLTLVQNVEITGIYGISFWIVLINVIMFNWLVRPFQENFIWILFSICIDSLAIRRVRINMFCPSRKFMFTKFTFCKVSRINNKYGHTSKG